MTTEEWKSTEEGDLRGAQSSGSEYMGDECVVIEVGFEKGLGIRIV